jgi:hypothetical protein
VQLAVLASSLTFIVLLLVYGGENSDSKEYRLITSMQGKFIISTFGLYLCIYLIVLTLLTSQMKKTYPRFYMRERGRIFLATISIIISISARMVFNFTWFLQSVQDALHHSILNNTWLYPTYQFMNMLCASFLPISSTIYSLMYMVTHKKNTMEREVTIDSPEQNNNV